MRTWRLESLLDSESGSEVEALISSFAGEAGRLREIAAELAELDAGAAASPALRDPDRLEEAEALLLCSRMEAAPLPLPPPALSLEEFSPGGSDAPAAVALARKIVQGHDASHNPFFVVGPPEHTLHLAAGVSNAIVAARPGTRVAFNEGSAFAEELRGAIAYGYLDAWRQRYRRLDLLGVEGVEALLTEPEPADAFLDLVEMLIRDGTQVILTARTTPRRLTDLDPRLLSRLEGGLVLDLVALAPRRPNFRATTAIPVGAVAPDRWFLNREKLAWDWVALSDRVIEELG
jgi:chromosomal replication initiation ATPase DnaA